MTYKNLDELYNDFKDCDAIMLMTLAPYLPKTKEYVQKIIQEKGGEAIFIAYEQFKEDKELMFLALNKLGLLSKESANKYKDLKEMIIEAAKKNGSDAIFACPKSLQNDLDIITTAREQDINSTEILNNPSNRPKYSQSNIAYDKLTENLKKLDKLSFNDKNIFKNIVDIISDKNSDELQKNILSADLKRVFSLVDNNIHERNLYIAFTVIAILILAATATSYAMNKHFDAMHKVIKHYDLKFDKKLVELATNLTAGTISLLAFASASLTIYHANEKHKNVTNQYINLAKDLKLPQEKNKQINEIYNAYKKCSAKITKT